MQLKVVRRYVHHPVPEQEGPVRGEDHPIATCYLLPRVYRFQHVRGSVQLHPDEVREPQQAERPEGDLHPPDVRHRHQQHPVRVRRRLGRDHQEQPQGLRTVLRRCVVTLSSALCFRPPSRRLSTIIHWRNNASSNLGAAVRKKQSKGCPC